MVESKVNIIVSFIFLTIIVLLWYLLFMGKERVDKNYSIIEYPSDHKKWKKKHRSKRHCTDYCHKSVCKQYQDRVKYYNYCKTCGEQNLCWSLNHPVCHKCSKEKNEECEHTKNFGCWNSRDNAYQSPIDPQYTGCQLCWKKKAKTI